MRSAAQYSTVLGQHKSLEPLKAGTLYHSYADIGTPFTKAALATYSPEQKHESSTTSALVVRTLKKLLLLCQFNLLDNSYIMKCLIISLPNITE